MCEWQNRDATQQQVPAEEKLDILVKRRADKSPVPRRQRQRAYDLSEGRKALIKVRVPESGRFRDHVQPLLDPEDSHR